MSGPVGKRLMARNTAYAVLGYFISFAIPVFMTPYLLSRLGLDRFGVWVALSVLASWLGHFALGIWNALSREVAARRAKGDGEGLRSLFSTWLAYDGVVGPLVAGAVLLAAPLLLRALAMDPSLVTWPVLAAVVAQAVLATVLRHSMYTLNGLQRMDRVNQMSMIAAPLWGAGTVAFVESDLGLFGLAANNVLFLVLQLLATVLFLRAERYPLGISGIRSGELRGLVSFGWKMEAGDLLGQILRSDRLILGPLGYPGPAVALYQFGAAIPDRLASGIIHLSSAILPAAADLAARGESERLRHLLLRSTKYHALAGAGLLGFAALFADELLLLWLGRSVPESALILRLMAVGAFAGTVCSPSCAVTVALSRPGLRTLAVVASLTGALLLYTGGLRRYDVPGIAAAVSGGTVLAQVLFMIGFRRLVEFRWREMVGNALLKPLAAGLPAVGVFAGWRCAAPHLPAVHDRLSALILLSGAFALSAALSWLAARATGALDAYDVDVLKSLGRRAPA